MSELVNMPRSGFRRQLLTTVSTLALLGAAYGAEAANDDDNRPPLWIELGGQLKDMNGAPEIFSPPFFAQEGPIGLDAMVKGQTLTRYSLGTEGKILFEPEDTNWILSAAVRYGRAETGKHLHQETPYPNRPFTVHGNYFFSRHRQPFGDVQSKLGELHLLLDFQVGKDIGLGLFGGHGSSVVSVGVRFAQFSSGSHGTFLARPTLHDVPLGIPGLFHGYSAHYHSYTAVFHAERSTHAVGPSISWNASVPFAGNATDTSVTFDWGVNASVLFGRQRALVHHQTTGAYFTGEATGHKISGYTNPPVDHDRARTVTIPNVGGFAGASFRYADAKVSFGYRADFFFGAMDGGIDAAKKENVGFYGPFATISVGFP